MRQAGFTLLELLVAMTLMALVAAGLSSGIHFGTRVWERTEAGRQAGSERQATRLLLQRTLQRLIPQSLSQEATETTILFAGDRTVLRFIGPAPAESAPPGLYRMEFALVPAGPGQALVFRWQPYAGEPLLGPFDAADRRVLLHGLDTAAFTYFGSREEGWLSAWGQRVDLPRLVRLDYVAPDERAQTLLFGTFLGLAEP